MYIKCTLSRPLDAAASLPRTQSCPPPHAFAFEAPSTHSHVPLGARRATSRKRNRRAGKRSTVSVQLTCRVLQGAAFSPLKHQRRVTSWCATTPTHLTANQQYTASVPLHSLARPKPCVPRAGVMSKSCTPQREIFLKHGACCRNRQRRECIYLQRICSGTCGLRALNSQLCN